MKRLSYVLHLYMLKTPSDSGIHNFNKFKRWLIVSPLYTHAYHFYCSNFILWFLWLSLTFHLKSYLSASLSRSGCLYPSENVCIFLLFLWENFSFYLILGGQFLSLSTSKIWSYFLLDSLVSDDNLQSFESLSSDMWCVIFLWRLSRFFINLYFSEEIWL